MKVAFFEYEEWMQDYVREYMPGQEVVFVSEPLTDKNAAKFADVEVASVFVFSKVTAGVMTMMPQLKLVAARSTGFDHIDVGMARQRGIVVTNVPTYGSITVAEHTWALILNLSRNIYRGYEMTEKSRFNVEGMRGFDLDGKTLGLVGLGEIGKRVALMSQGFGMKLRIFNRSKDFDFLNRFENAVFVDRIEDVYSHSDVISFHLPLTPETYHALNINNYRQLKPGCIVVNTARGGVIEAKALLRGLQEGLIRGAGLDVLEAEQAMKNVSTVDLDNLPNEHELSEAYFGHMLIGRDDVVITPHNAFNSDESIRRLVNSNLDNILHFGKGELDKLDQVN